MRQAKGTTMTGASPQRIWRAAVPIRGGSNSGLTSAPLWPQNSQLNFEGESRVPHCSNAKFLNDPHRTISAITRWHARRLSTRSGNHASVCVRLQRFSWYDAVAPAATISGITVANNLNGPKFLADEVIEW